MHPNEVRGRHIFEGILKKFDARDDFSIYKYYFPYRAYDYSIRFGTPHKRIKPLFEIPDDLDEYFNKVWDKFMSIQMVFRKN